MHVPMHPTRSPHHAQTNPRMRALFALLLTLQTGKEKQSNAGAAAQVGAGVLNRVLKRLRVPDSDPAVVAQGLEQPDDAAVLRPPPEGHVSVQVTEFDASSVAQFQSNPENDMKLVCSLHRSTLTGTI